MPVASAAVLAVVAVVAAVAICLEDAVAVAALEAVLPSELV